MNNKINLIKLLIGIPCFAFLLFSCKKQNLYRDANYPDQVIYMPAAVNGIFIINSIPQRIGNVPTTGMAYQFTIDSGKNMFIVPFGVFRGGVNTKGSANVAISVNTDTITKMINGGNFTGASSGAELLPADKYSIESSVNLPDGAELATFKLSVDLSFLRANRGKIYALGISISSKEIKSNPKLNTTILVIDTKFLIPIATFTSTVDASDDKKLNFLNTSTNALTYSWDFGDGSALSTEKSPSHTFTTYGNHSVTLTVKGITGDISTVTNVIKLYEDVTNMYFKNPGFPFLRKDGGTERWGLLKDWIYTANVPNQYGNTRGGFSNDDASGYIHFESTDWSGPGLTNGKVYQTFTLPPGDYKASFKLQNGGGIYLDANFVVAIGAGLPDVANLGSAAVLGKYSWNGSKTDFGTFSVDFSITIPTEVSIGWVMSFGSFAYTRIAGVTLIR